MYDIGNILSRLKRVKGHNGSWSALCPAHDDHDPSLSVRTGDDGRILLHCHAGCAPESILATLGLSMSDLFQPNGNGNGKGRKRQGQGKVVKAYDYIDESGKCQYQVVRFFPKEFRQRRPDGKGGWINDLKGASPLIYHLPGVIKAVRDAKTIFIVEGEKDVETLEPLGLVATCNSGGAGKFPQNMVPHFKGSNVVILPDNDEPGERHALKVAGMLQGVAKEIRIVRLPGLPAKGDVSDWIQNGGTRDVLDKLVKASPLWKLDEKETVPDEEDFHLTDSGNAKRLVQRYVSVIRFNKTPFGKWFIWSGVRWMEDATDKIYEYADRVVRSLYELAANTIDSRKREEIAAWAKSSETAQRKKNMVFLAEKEQSIVIEAPNLDSDPLLFNCQNATIDLSSGEAVPREHRQADNITMLSPVLYDPKADCPKWKEFLRDIFAGNEELEVFVKRAVGYSLTGDVSEQCLFFAYGTGKNGKSVFFEVLKMLFGDYAVKAPSEMIMQQRENSIPADIARLKGKRLAIASEIAENRRLSENRVKDITGGDTIIARKLYGDWFEYKPTHKLWIYGNHKPIIRGEDIGIWRRLKLIPFITTISEEKRRPMAQLLEIFRNELPGILNWALQGYVEYREKGLFDPDAITQAIKQYKGEMDIIGQFIEECCYTGEVEQVLSSSLYKKYKEWCEINSESPLSNLKFLNKLKERGFDLVQGHSRQRIVNGISLIGD